jgi:Predicted transcriptional regulator with C-terminal CBS domains
VNKNIGENIVKCRKINGMSQGYLAKRIGITSQGLLKIEKGIVSPRAETLEKIMLALCVTPNQLFGIERITEDNSSIVEKLRKLQAQ